MLSKFICILFGERHLQMELPLNSQYLLDINVIQCHDKTRHDSRLSAEKNGMKK